MLNVADIPYQENYNTVINHLYCPEENCGVALSYVRGRNGGYLKKHMKAKHSETCIYSDDETRIKAANTFIEIDSNLSEQGILRRKKRMVNILSNYLLPSQNIEEKKGNRNAKAAITTKVANHSGTTMLRVKYDPESLIDKNSIGKHGRGVREPAFIPVLLHQISSRDAYKNLLTAGIIESIEIDKENNFANIVISFEKMKGTLHLPPSFFSNSIRGVSKEQLFDYLKLLANYNTDNPQTLYVISMCQTQTFNLGNVVLQVYDPDFLSFISKKIPGKVFKKLSNLVAAIDRKVI